MKCMSMQTGSEGSKYAYVGRAPEAYGSQRVYVSVCVFRVHFSTTAKN